MNLFGLFAVLVTVTAVLSYVNQRTLRLPQAIGVMAAALGLSLVLIALGGAGLGIRRWAEGLVLQVDFNVVLMKGMLSFLLFAGSLHVDLDSLRQRGWTILTLSTLGVLLSTVIVGTGFHGLVRWFGIEMPFAYALLFGALIAPTDPIAVLGILKKAGAPPGLEAKIIGESLFNDGVGVVLFAILLDVAVSGEGSFATAGLLFVEEALGGALVGLVLGYTAYRMLRGVDHFTAEVLITLALVAGGYALAGALHTSGPIAMVVAGLFIGNHGRVYGMSPATRAHLDTFWELTDEILNSLLFVLIGLELLILAPVRIHVAVGVLAIPLVLAARFVSVGLPVSLLRMTRTFGPYTVSLLTWGGIRGGISIALALSLPRSAFRDLILVATYTIVVFSILVQGLTVRHAVRWAFAGSR